MKVPLPRGKYIKQIQVNDDGLEVEFADRKKIALLLIGINDKYWPYLRQVIDDCKQNFLPQHDVTFFVWSDIPQEDTEEYKTYLNGLLSDVEFNIAIQEKRKPPSQWWGRETTENTVEAIRNNKDIVLKHVDSIEWPSPTLMRYHLFVQEKEELEKFDYLFYMDADMRVVDKISDEVLGEGLTAAEHPMYSLRTQYVPPYEPNMASAAYIHRLGQVVDDNGKPRFKPYYVAGGFQGGRAKQFLAAMEKMIEGIDKDFNSNYIAIWNDESHWNKYLWDYYKGSLTVLSPSYIYPDSLIEEYYKPLWGREYQPKIITLTKPFSLSAQGGSELNKMLGKESASVPSFSCPQCGGKFETPGYSVRRVIECPGSDKPHQLEMDKIK